MAGNLSAPPGRSATTTSRVSGSSPGVRTFSNPASSSHARSSGTLNQRTTNCVFRVLPSRTTIALGDEARVLDVELPLVEHQVAVTLDDSAAAAG